MEQPTELGELTFEQILRRLSEVVDELEQGDLPLERSLATFEEGIRLSRAGASRLDDAERRIEELLSTDPVRKRPLDLARESDRGEAPQ